MKDTLKAILAVVTLIFGLSVIGCVTTGNQTSEVAIDLTPTKFEGEWINLYGTANLTYTFRGNSFLLTDNLEGKISGTFSYTDTKITFSIVKGDRSRAITQNYSSVLVECGVLNLEKIPNAIAYGPFYKDGVEIKIFKIKMPVVSTAPTKIEGTWKYLNKKVGTGTFTFIGNQFTYIQNGIDKRSGFFILENDWLILVVDNQIVRIFSYTLKEKKLKKELYLKSEYYVEDFYYWGYYYKQ